MGNQVEVQEDGSNDALTPLRRYTVSKQTMISPHLASPNEAQVCAFLNHRNSKHEKKNPCNGRDFLIC